MNLKVTLSLLACIGTPCAAQASTTSGTKNISTVAEAIDTAIEYCSHAGPQIFQSKIETEAYADGFPNTKPMSELPEAIQNFVSDSSRFSPIGIVFEIRSPDGQIWLAPSNVRCDVAFTGFKNSDVENTVISAFAESSGWTTRLAQPKSEKMPLTRYLFQKSLPTKSEYPFISRAQLRSLGTTTETADGIQIEINFLKGELRPQGAPPASDRRQR